MCGIPWPPHGLLARREWELGTPKMPGYRDVISNGPFSIAIADTDKRGKERRIHNSAPFPFVQVMTLGNVIY